MPKPKPPEYWVDNDPHIAPHVGDIGHLKIPAVRVMRRSPPFAFGEVVAFFIGGDAESDAEDFCDFMNLRE